MFDALYAQAQREDPYTGDRASGDKARKRAYQEALRALVRELGDEFDELFEIELARVEAEGPEEEDAEPG